MLFNLKISNSLEVYKFNAALCIFFLVKTSHWWIEEVVDTLLN